MWPSIVTSAYICSFIRFVIFKSFIKQQLFEKYPIVRFKNEAKNSWKFSCYRAWRQEGLFILLKQSATYRSIIQRTATTSKSLTNNLQLFRLQSAETQKTSTESRRSSFKLHVVISQSDRLNFASSWEMQNMQCTLCHWHFLAIVANNNSFSPIMKMSWFITKSLH